MSGTAGEVALSQLTDARRLLVSDFDGTMTAFDFFERVLARLGSDPHRDYWGEYLAGRISHFEALKGIFSLARGGEQAVAEIARETGLDPQLPEAASRLRDAGWELLIVSAGCTWYIERLLDERGVEIPIVSNPGTIADDGSLHMSLPADSPFYSPQTGIDKLAVVRWAQQRFDDVAFAGDGRPDEAPARLVPPQHRFARGWLAEKFTFDGTPFQPFDRWSEISIPLSAADDGSS